jgi:creatinine amidohydrolase
MTSAAVSDAVAKGQLDVLVPLGAMEQHGAHLPLATDQIIAESIAGALADRLPTSLLVAPCLPIGYSDYHFGFAGTVSVSRRLIQEFLEAIIDSLLGSGFRHVYLISGHAGNLDPMQVARRAFPPEMRARIAVQPEWSFQRTVIQEWAQAQLGLSPSEVGGHAGHFETSVMLLVAPELVKMDRAAVGFLGDPALASATMMADGIRAVSPNGVIGDPRTATAEAGAGYLDVVVNQVLTLIEGHRLAQSRQPNNH